MLLNTFNCPIMSHCCVSWGDYPVSGINHQRCNFIYYAYALKQSPGGDLRQVQCCMETFKLYFV